MKIFVVTATTLERTARTTITHASYLSLCEANNGLSLPPNIKITKMKRGQDTGPTMERKKFTRKMQAKRIIL